MTSVPEDVGIYGSRAALSKMTRQLKEACADTSRRIDVTFYARLNTTRLPREVRLHFSNDDSEPEDGGRQGHAVDDLIVDFEG